MVILHSMSLPLLLVFGTLTFLQRLLSLLMRLIKLAQSLFNEALMA